MKHPDRPGARLVIPVHAGQDLLPKTLANILDNAGMAGEELRKLL
jgi:predicted RNA binding protein YcfA (HicA-like mRNA interferase family)